MALGATDDLTAEMALAAIGLENWLRAQCKFGVTERDKVRTSKRRLDKEMLEFLSAETVPVGPLPSITWTEAQELLFPKDQGKEHERALSLLRAVRAPRFAMAVQAVAEKATAYLQQVFPRTIRMFMAGDKIGPPNNLDWARFREMWEVGTGPDSVMQALREGTLNDRQVGALETMYPALYATVSQAATDAIITMKAKRPKWYLTLPKERQLSKLQQREAPNLPLGLDIQAMYAGKSGGQPPKPKGPATTEKSSEERLTPAQKTEEA